MIVVADSGSTKCDWMITSKDGEANKTKTMGFNPFFHSSELIFEELNKNTELKSISQEIDGVYFYGAGCSSPERNNIVAQALSKFFNNASEILVDHDLTGAAIAACGDEIGVACILGTGSNSCFYDGNSVTEAVPALGYVLGDEGSGAYFGKYLMKEYLYKRLPQELRSKLENTYELSKEIIFHRVYNSPNPNVYLASFMPFVSDHKDHPWIQDMMYMGLADFAKAHILCFDNYNQNRVHFVGSIAYYFKSELEKVGKDLGFEVGNIEKRPINPLCSYHLNALVE